MTPTFSLLNYSQVVFFLCAFFKIPPAIQKKIRKEKNRKGSFDSIGELFSSNAKNYFLKLIYKKKTFGIKKKESPRNLPMKANKGTKGTPVFSTGVIWTLSRTIYLMFSPYLNLFFLEMSKCQFSFFKLIC